jgi:phage-related protein
MEFKANETRHLEIVFKPQPPGTESLIYICVNDSQDRVIETIAVSAKVRSSASTATVCAPRNEVAKCIWIMRVTPCGRQGPKEADKGWTEVTQSQIPHTCFSV